MQFYYYVCVRCCARARCARPHPAHFALPRTHGCHVCLTRRCPAFCLCVWLVPGCPVRSYVRCTRLPLCPFPGCRVQFCLCRTFLLHTFRCWLLPLRCFAFTPLLVTGSYPTHLCVAFCGSRFPARFAFCLCPIRFGCPVGLFVVCCCSLFTVALRLRLQLQFTFCLPSYVYVYLYVLRYLPLQFVRFTFYLCYFTLLCCVVVVIAFTPFTVALPLRFTSYSCLHTLLLPFICPFTLRYVLRSVVV